MSETSPAHETDSGVAPDVDPGGDVALDPQAAVSLGEDAGATDAGEKPLTADPDAMVDTPDELGGTAGGNAGGAG